MRTPHRYALAATLAIGLAACGAVVAQSALTKVPAEVQPGRYQLDSSHGRITWSVDHMGFSTYIGQFINVQAELRLDPADPSASSLTATVPIRDVAPNDDQLKAHLLTADFFDAENHPTAVFRSTRVVVDPSDPDEARVEGELTLRGVTRPVTLEVEFNQAGPSMGGAYRAGFDAEAVIRRSEFGINYALPGVSDEVELRIEGEFVKQPSQASGGSSTS